MLLWYLSSFCNRYVIGAKSFSKEILFTSILFFSELYGCYQRIGIFHLHKAVMRFTERCFWCKSSSRKLCYVFPWASNASVNQYCQNLFLAIIEFTCWAGKGHISTLHFGFFYQGYRPAWCNFAKILSISFVFLKCVQVMGKVLYSWTLLFLLSLRELKL